MSIVTLHSIGSSTQRQTKEMYANKTDENNKQRLKSDLQVILPVIRKLVAVFYRGAGDSYTR